MDETQDWYFTFGFGQPHEGKYHVIHGTYDEARELMHERFNRVWGFQYSEAEWLNEDGVSQADEYGLARLP